MSTVTTRRSRTKPRKLFHIALNQESPVDATGLLFAVSSDAWRDSGSLFSLSRKGERVSGACRAGSRVQCCALPRDYALRASIHHDLDAVARLDLGVRLEPVEDAEALCGAVDARHAV